MSSLTRYLYSQLVRIRHTNGNPVVEVYGKHAMGDSAVQGGIVSLSLLGREKRACADTNDLFRGIPLGASGCERGV